MKDREIVCEHYVCKGNCKLGKNADFRGLCQTCPSYRKLAGAKPARIDSRRKKLDKILKKEKWQ